MKTLSRSGFSIIELMVVVSVIGIIASLAMPGISQVRNRAQATVAANDLQKFAQALQLYSMQTGSYPLSLSVQDIPEQVASQLPSVWRDGAYNWMYINSDLYTCLLVFGLRFNTEQAVRLDRIIDDGNIAMGKVIIAPNGNGLVYFLEQDS